MIPSGAYIDDLWRRIGEKLKVEGIKQEDISTAIKETRNTKNESRQKHEQINRH
jgi:hypothetical protein